jgi:hypothetical protein
VGLARFVFPTVGDCRRCDLGERWDFGTRDWLRRWNRPTLWPALPGNLAGNKECPCQGWWQEHSLDLFYEFLSGYGTLSDLCLRGIEPGGECARRGADLPLALVGAGVCPGGRPGVQDGRSMPSGRPRPGPRVPSDGTTGCWPRSGRAGGAARGSSCPLNAVRLAGPGAGGGLAAVLLLAQGSPLLLVKPGPDAELVDLGRVLEAVLADTAAGADLACFCAEIAVRREENLRVRADAQSTGVPFV